MQSQKLTGIRLPVVRSKWGARVVLAIWILVNGVPFLLISRYREILILQNVVGRSLDLAAALTVLPFLYLLELAVLVFLFGLAKGFRGSVWAKGIILSASILGGILYFSFEIGSWYLFASTGAFANASTLSMLQGIDLSTLLFDITSGDLLALGLGITLAVSITSTIYLLSRPLTTRGSRQNALTHPILLAILTFAPLLVVKYSKGPSAWPALRGLWASAVSPQFAAYITPALLPGEGAINRTVPLVLHRVVEEKELEAKEEQRPSSQKHVFLFIVEALRADIVGKEIDGIELTPNLNKLAAAGRNFSRAYAVDAETHYSQTTILSGQHPLRYPWRDTYTNRDYPHTTLFDLFSKHGFRTAYFSLEWAATRRVSHSPGLEFVFDPIIDSTKKIRPFLPKGLSLPDSLAKEAPWDIDRIHLEALKGWVAQSDSNSLAVVYLYSTHFPYESPATILGQKIPLDALPISKSPNFFGYPSELAPILLARYYRTAYVVDALIGNFIEYLEEKPWFRDSIIVITGDHGELFHEHGEVTHAGHLFEEAIRVPLIFFAPGRIDPGADFQLATHLDIAPSLAALAQYDPVYAFQGVDLFNNAKMKHLCSRPLVITNQTAIFEDALIAWPWKLRVNYSRDQALLYNLDADPQEQQNLTERLPKVLHLMQQGLQKFRSQQFSYYSGDVVRRRTSYPPRDIENPMFSEQECRLLNERFAERPYQ